VCEGILVEDFFFVSSGFLLFVCGCGVFGYFFVFVFLFVIFSCVGLCLLCFGLLDRGWSGFLVLFFVACCRRAPPPPPAPTQPATPTPRLSGRSVSIIRRLGLFCTALVGLLVDPWVNGRKE